MICNWCKEELIWTKEGWRHQDGTLYKQKTNEKGELVDDHCVLAGVEL